MQNILSVLILLGILSITDVRAQSSKSTTQPTNKASYDQLSRDDYKYNPYYNDEEIAKEKALKIKQEKMKAQKRALEAKQQVAQKALQKKNKAAYDKAMKEFEKSKQKSKTENIIIISDKPI